MSYQAATLAPSDALLVAAADLGRLTRGWRSKSMAFWERGGGVPCRSVARSAGHGTCRLAERGLTRTSRRPATGIPSSASPRRAPLHGQETAALLGRCRFTQGGGGAATVAAELVTWPGSPWNRVPLSMEPPPCHAPSSEGGEAAPRARQRSAAVTLRSRGLDRARGLGSLGQCGAVRGGSPARGGLVARLAGSQVLAGIAGLIR